MYREAQTENERRYRHDITTRDNKIADLQGRLGTLQVKNKRETDTGEPTHRRIPTSISKQR